MRIQRRLNVVIRCPQAGRRWSTKEGLINCDQEYYYYKGIVRWVKAANADAASWQWPP